MNLTGSAFVPGPYPKSGNFLAPITGPDAIYSGLLECPLTDRIQRTVDGAAGFNDSYQVVGFEGCGAGPGPNPPGPDPPAFCVKNAVNGISGDVPKPGTSTANLVCHGKTTTALICEAACAADRKCSSFTWVSPAFADDLWREYCYLRHAVRALGPVVW